MPTYLQVEILSSCNCLGLCLGINCLMSCLPLDKISEDLRRTSGGDFSPFSEPRCHAARTAARLRAASRRCRSPACCFSSLGAGRPDTRPTLQSIRIQRPIAAYYNDHNDGLLLSLPENNGGARKAFFYANGRTHTHVLNWRADQRRQWNDLHWWFLEWTHIGAH